MRSAWFGLWQIPKLLLWFNHKRYIFRRAPMLVTFKSKAAAEVLMYEDHAKRILDLVGKDVKRGVITADEAARAIATLEAEIAQSRMHSAAEDVRHDVEAHHGDAGDDTGHEP